MRLPPAPFPETSQIQFQISLLNIASVGAAGHQAKELEKLLDDQSAIEKR